MVMMMLRWGNKYLIWSLFSSDFIICPITDSIRYTPPPPCFPPMLSSKVYHPMFIIRCYHPMLSSDVIIRCYHLMLSSIVIIRCYHPMLSSDVIIRCYHPMLSSDVIIRCYHPMFSSHVIIQCYHPMLSSHVITQEITTSIFIIPENLIHWGRGHNLMPQIMTLCIMHKS
jgi:hypothetical protein